MRAKEYPALLEAVEEGVGYGLRRAWKHRTMPALSPEDLAAIGDEVAQQVVAAILERFDLEPEAEAECPCVPPGARK